MTIHEHINELLGESQDGITRAEAIAQQIVAAAERGDVLAAKLVLDAETDAAMLDSERDDREIRRSARDSGD